MVNWFKKKNEPDLKFIDTLGYPTKDFPIRLAKHEPLNCADKQKESYGKMKFHMCPGMLDYAKMGYIVPAWDSIKIKANKAGVVAFRSRAKSEQSVDVVPMDEALIEGVFQPDGIPLKAFKLDSPWRVTSSSEVSALIIPAFYHSKFLDDIYVVPGVVDYKSFNVMNFIFSVKRECELTINAGDPLLHVIPFHNKEISATFGTGTVEDASASPLYYINKHWYRKKDSIKKSYTIEKS